MTPLNSQWWIASRTMWFNLIVAVCHFFNA